MLAVSAQGLTPEQVRRNAQQFADGIVGKQPAVIKDVALPISHHIAAYNIEGGGFVIASTDSRTRPVLAWRGTTTR